MWPQRKWHKCVTIRRLPDNVVNGLIYDVGNSDAVRMSAELIGVPGVGVAVAGLILTGAWMLWQRALGHWNSERLRWSNGWLWWRDRGRGWTREANATAATVTDAAARKRPAGIPATGSATCCNRLGVYEIGTARLMLEP